MRRVVIGALLIGGATPAMAQSVKVMPLAEARLRYEAVEQDGIGRDADAITLRVRTGVQAAAGPWSALVEAQGNLAVVGDYYDGLNGTATRPLVADPQNIALYRAQIAYRTRALAVTAGRQRIALDDERFVGNVAFRQNAQTFDAVRVEWTTVPRLKADVTYAWSVRTIWGIDGHNARQQAVGGDNVFANLSYVTPIGTLTGFAYLIDQDEAAVQGYRLSSQSYGARIAGTRPIGRARVAYQASYARQSGYRRNPNDYRADYYLADVALDLNGPRLGAGYEVLGASRGVALKAVSVQAAWHRFESDRLVRHYGSELDLLASAKLGRTTASVRYADYHAARFATDSRKFWLQLDWTI